jgi:hypothetical protein
MHQEMPLDGRLGEIETGVRSGSGGSNEVSNELGYAGRVRLEKGVWLVEITCILCRGIHCRHNEAG